MRLLSSSYLGTCSAGKPCFFLSLFSSLIFYLFLLELIDKSLPFLHQFLIFRVVFFLINWVSKVILRVIHSIKYMSNLHWLTFPDKFHSRTIDFAVNSKVQMARGPLLLSIFEKLVPWKLLIRCRCPSNFRNSLVSCRLPDQRNYVAYTFLSFKIYYLNLNSNFINLSLN